jgi:hypothetical protein
MSRLPPFIRKNARAGVATAIPATAATVEGDCSNNSDCSSSKPASETALTPTTVATLATVAVAGAEEGFSGSPSTEAQRWRRVFEEIAREHLLAGLSWREAEWRAMTQVSANWNGAGGCYVCGKEGADLPVAVNSVHLLVHLHCREVLQPSTPSMYVRPEDLLGTVTRILREGINRS